MTQTPKQVNPTPADLVTPTEFDTVLIPVTRLFEARAAAGRGALENLTFRHCVIRGPGVLVPTAKTNFRNCNLGDVAGNTRNLFLQASGPMIIGGISVAGCQFEDCLFTGVGFAGDEVFIEFFLKQLSGSGGQA